VVWCYQVGSTHVIAGGGQASAASASAAGRGVPALAQQHPASGRAQTTQPQAGARVVRGIAMTHFGENLKTCIYKFGSRIISVLIYTFSVRISLR
jgi:hypothetical protein